MKARWTRRLVVRLYLSSLVSVIVTGALCFVFLVMYKAARQEDLGLWTEQAVGDLALRSRDPQSLRVALDRLERRSRELTLYDSDGNLITSSASPPLPMISRSELAQLAHQPFVSLDTWRFASAVREEGKIVAVGIIVHRPPPVTKLVAPLGILLAVSLVVTGFIARHLARPLVKITRAARRFGHGELGARAGVSRSDEIGELARAFDEMADRVTTLMTAQRELMANISHELQTPLSRIHVAVDLMTDGAPDEARELLPEIAADLAELERLIDDVMTVARLDLARSDGRATATPLRLQTTSAEELIQKAASRFRSQHQSHQLVVDVLSGLPPLTADPVLLRRAIDNLLDNARKYSEPQSSIRVSAAPAPHGLSIAVSDDGMGMDEQDLKQVFTPFFRSDRSRSRATGGVGLGLVLARRVVEAHGGTIAIESAPGQGTTVTLALPAAA